MPGRANKEKRKAPAAVRREHERLQRALLDTFKRLWEEGDSTQVATLSEAGLSVQSWGKWTRGTDMTLGSLVAIAYALGRRIDFDLQSMSDPASTVPVVTNEEGVPLTDDVLRLAERIDQLPHDERLSVMGEVRGLLSATERHLRPSVPAAEQRGHSGRGSK